jgi:hypothetical protein
MAYLTQTAWVPQPRVWKSGGIEWFGCATEVPSHDNRGFSMARHAAVRPRWARRITVTAGAATIALISGGSVWFADAASSTRTVQACYATHGGTLRVLGHTPCKSTERAIHWNAAGPAGPPGIAAAYVGQAHFKSAHRLSDQASVLEAETPKLPAGDYVVDAMADVGWKGLGNAMCFDSVVSIAPSSGGEFSSTFDSDEPLLMYGSIAVDRAFRNVPAGDRLGLYCKNVGSADSDDYSAIDSADLNALRVNALAVTTVSRK